MADMSKQELTDRLLAIDEEAALTFDDAERLRIIIVGGSALVLLECIKRSTHDIDALSCSAKLQKMLADYDINCMVMTFINNFPYNYEDRIVPLDLPTKIIDFYTASLEDIVIAKLYSQRPADRKDITSPEVLDRLNWDLLKALVDDEEEVKLNALNERCYNDFLYAYTEYERRYRP